MARTHQRKRMIGMVAALLAVGLLTTAARAAPNKQGRDRKQGARQKNNDRPRAKEHGDRPRAREHGDRDKGRLTVGVSIGDHGKDRWRHRPDQMRHQRPHHRGRYVRRWVPPLYRSQFRRHGGWTRIVIRAGYYATVWVPAPAVIVTESGCQNVCCDQHRPRQRSGGGLVISGSYRF